jgi:hypothetical protein
METMIDGVTYVLKAEGENGSCCGCAAESSTSLCAALPFTACQGPTLIWLKKDDPRQQVEINKAFGHQMPLFPEIEPPVTAEEDEAFNDLSKAQKDYIEAIGTDPLSTQVGGGHYKSMAIQPIEFITKNNLPYCEANVVKYISRWRDKGGKKDLEKAKHYIDLLIQLEGL